MKKNYGLIFEERDPNAFVLGAGKLPEVVLKEDGQWDNFLPVYEYQAQDYETYGCTAYGSLNLVEIMIKRLTNFEENLSDRFIYNVAEINPPGADPHRILEVIRNSGAIPEKDLPRPSTLKEFKTPRPMSQDLLDKGLEFPWEVKHEYVKWNDLENKKYVMKNALRYSPLGVSVSAWTERNGVYVDDGRPNNHWCVIYGWNAKGWKCFDTYDGGLKTLAWDHTFQVCKRIHLEKNNRLPKISIITKLLNLLKEMLGLIPDTTTEENTQEKPILPQITTSTREIIYQKARESLGIDVSPEDGAPDDLACVDSVCQVLKKAGIEIPNTFYTTTFKQWLDKSPRFKYTTESKPGNIIISYTDDPRKNGNVPRGHVGIFGENGWIMSNDGTRGIWLENYTLSGWVEKFRNRGGYRIFFYEAQD